MWIEEAKENVDWWEIKFFINPNWYTPSAVITIFEKDWGIYARYPSWRTQEIDKENPEKWLNFLRRSNPVMEIPWKDKIWGDEYAFAFSEKEFIIGPPPYVVAILKRRLVENILSEKDERLITEYIANSGIIG